ncbi:MAG TPA: cation:proton antiporter [Patescibacteria group bacterium]|nr:cation:proton antiporter [Patescibacteria group bacterium]
MSAIHEFPLISIIAIGLTLAFLGGLLAHKLKISPIVGYLLAGVIVGPHSPGFVADGKVAEELSEIGIVLLMFGVGLHFSIEDFLEVKKIALTGALARIVAVTLMGMGLTHLWGWPLEGGLLFGLALSVASTVVLLRVFEERGYMHLMSGRIAVGWLIVEDLAMVLTMVLIPAVVGALRGSGGGFPVVQLALVAVKIGIFVAIMMVAGRRALPWLLGLVAKTGSRELFTLAVFSMAVGVAFGASVLFGVSTALGAFFAGMMIRESDLNHEVADRALPFQDAFAVLFFIGIGMLFNPAILIQQPLHVLTVTSLIMLGKFLIVFAIVWLFGYSLKISLLLSAGLAQIGEFSFILVALGLQQNLLPEAGRDLILAGAMASIALNPVLFFISRRLYEFADKRPQISKLFNARDGDLSHLSGGEKHALRDLIILVGHGRVGKYIRENLETSAIDLVIVDRNRERVESLRKQGFHAIAGDAAAAETLEKSAVQKALAIVVAVPDAFEARRIVDAARGINPSLKVLVRAHNDEEMDYFAAQNVDLPVTGPREIGRRMVEYLKQINKGEPERRATR